MSMSDETIELKNGEKLSINYGIGLILSVIGMLIQLILAPWFFLLHYELLMVKEIEVAKCPTCVYIIKYFLPAYTDVAIIAGIFYFIAAIGFYRKDEWSVKMAMIGNILALFTSFWPMIPEMDTGVPILYAAIFLPNVVLWFVIARYAGNISWGRIMTGLFTGMAMVTTFMNGTASVNMYMKTLRSPDARVLIFTTPKGNPYTVAKVGEVFFVMTQRLNWLAAIGMMIVTYYVLFRPDDKIRLLGIVSGLISLILGTPLGIKISFMKNEISMMLYAPILAFIYLIVFIYTPFWNKLVEPVDLKN